MSKNIAIIHDDFHPLIFKVKEFLEDQSCRVDFLPWSDLAWHLGQNHSLSQYNAIYLDRMGEKSASYSTQLDLLAELAKTPGAPGFINEALSYWRARNKALMSVEFQKAKLPIPETLIAYNKKQIQEFCFKSNSTQFVAKSILGFCANDVHVFNRSEIPVVTDKILERDGIILVQNFIFNPLRYIWRIDVVNNKVIVANQRYAYNQDPQFPLCNGSLGGAIKFWKPNEVPPKVASLALQATSTLGLKLAGVDLLVDEHDNVFVGEVNPEPDITLDHFEFPMAIANYLRSL